MTLRISTLGRFVTATDLSYVQGICSMLTSGEAVAARLACGYLVTAPQWMSDEVEGMAENTVPPADAIKEIYCDLYTSYCCN